MEEDTRKPSRLESISTMYRDLRKSTGPSGSSRRRIRATPGDRVSEPSRTWTTTSVRALESLASNRAVVETLLSSRRSSVATKLSTDAGNSSTESPAQRPPIRPGSRGKTPAGHGGRQWRSWRGRALAASSHGDERAPQPARLPTDTGRTRPARSGAGVSAPRSHRPRAQPSTWRSAVGYAWGPSRRCSARSGRAQVQTAHPSRGGERGPLPYHRDGRQSGRTPAQRHGNSWPRTSPACRLPRREPRSACPRTPRQPSEDSESSPVNQHVPVKKPVASTGSVRQRVGLPFGHELLEGQAGPPRRLGDFSHDFVSSDVAHSPVILLRPVSRAAPRGSPAEHRGSSRCSRSVAVVVVGGERDVRAGRRRRGRRGPAAPPRDGIWPHSRGHGLRERLARSNAAA